MGRVISYTFIICYIGEVMSLICNFLFHTFTHTYIFAISSSVNLLAPKFRRFSSTALCLSNAVHHLPVFTVKRFCKKTPRHHKRSKYFGVDSCSGKRNTRTTRNWLKTMIRMRGSKWSITSVAISERTSHL